MFQSELLSNNHNDKKSNMVFQRDRLIDQPVATNDKHV